MKKWLEYSATGRLESGEITNKEPDSEFEEHVARRIRGLGCEVDYQVGVSNYRIDLGVRHPKWPYGYLLGVECDGATYHSSRVARDRDRLRERDLRGKGWELHRVWSTNWFQDEDGEVEKIRATIAQLLQRDSPQLPPQAPPPPVMPGAAIDLRTEWPEESTRSRSASPERTRKRAPQPSQSMSVPASARKTRKSTGPSRRAAPQRNTPQKPPLQEHTTIPSPPTGPLQAKLGDSVTVTLVDGNDEPITKRLTTAPRSNDTSTGYPVEFSPGLHIVGKTEGDVFDARINGVLRKIKLYKVVRKS